MSEIMVNDVLMVNNINPFWDEPPGSWSKPYNYTPSVKNTIERESQELGVNDRGVEHRCNLNRPLYPHRNIDGGLWTLDDPVVEPSNGFFSFIDSNMLLLVLIVLVILWFLSQ